MANIDTTNIEKALKTWLDENGYDELDVEVGEDFLFYQGIDLISVALAQPQFCIEAWDKFLAELGLNIVIDSFYSSFLHELGHYETLHLFDEDEITESINIRMSLAEKDNITEENHLEYWRLPEEIAATQWAVDFMNENTEAVRHLCELVQPAIKEFFEREDVHA